MYDCILRIFIIAASWPMHLSLQFSLMFYFFNPEFQNFEFPELETSSPERRNFVKWKLRNVFRANTKHFYNICTMLGRRCTNVIKMFFFIKMFAGLVYIADCILKIFIIAVSSILSSLQFSSVQLLNKLLFAFLRII